MYSYDPMTKKKKWTETSFVQDFIIILFFVLLQSKALNLSEHFKWCPSNVSQLSGGENQASPTPASSLTPFDQTILIKLRPPTP